MARKKYSAPEKLKHVISSFNDGVIITNYCVVQKVSRSTLYRWRRDFSSAFDKKGFPRR